MEYVIYQNIKQKNTLVVPDQPLRTPFVPTVNDKTGNFSNVLQILKKANRLKVYIQECHVKGNQKLSKGPSKQLPHVNLSKCLIG